MGAEAYVENAVCRYAKKKGCIVRKFASPSHRGVPDRLFIAPNGVTGFIEFKAPKKKPTALQMREIALYAHNNAPVTWVDNPEDGKAFIDQLTNMKKPSHMTAEEYALTVQCLCKPDMLAQMEPEDEMFIQGLKRAKHFTLAQKKQINDLHSKLHPVGEQAKDDGSDLLG